jgi:hypothetical protein
MDCLNVVGVANHIFFVLHRCTKGYIIDARKDAGLTISVKREGPVTRALIELTAIPEWRWLDTEGTKVNIDLATMVYFIIDQV